jgi:hypothetical protein
LSTLRETDDNQIDLFSSNLDDEQAIVVPQTEVKKENFKLLKKFFHFY